MQITYSKTAPYIHLKFLHRQIISLRWPRNLPHFLSARNVTVSHIQLEDMSEGHFNFKRGGGVTAVPNSTCVKPSRGVRGPECGSPYSILCNKVGMAEK